MIFKNPYWTPQTKLDLLARWIIVHSIIYYELNGNIVGDKMFDNNSQQFVSLVDDHFEEFKQSPYYKIMKDFDGNTGFDLFGKLNKYNRKEANNLYNQAQQLLIQFGSEVI